MSKSIFSRTAKIFAVFSVCFLAAASLPAAAETAVAAREDEALRNLFAANSTLGFVKTRQLDGNRPVTPEQVMKIFKIYYDAFPKIIAEVRKAGLYDDFRKESFDPELRRLDAEAAGARTMDEFKSIAERQISHIQKEYLRLWNWSNSSEEMSDIMARIFEEVDAVLK